ncbi:UvrD-helicase domain-containing protein [Marinobacterium aestuariivivens]|uniref:DNA 3'-5' helicase n=1 Tax=Marinobacterium aestuariivivens TaxID=1698799 RepID=A0ABW1ZY78_9GAMM
MHQFTSQQIKAIEYDGSMIISACPGSGKTTVIKEKIRRITCNLPAYKGVIAITFTIKSSQELKERCKKDGHDTKQSFFGTIDSFCLNEIIVPFISRHWGGDISECQIVKKLDEKQKGYFSEHYKSPTLSDILKDDGFQNLYHDGFLWMSSFSAIALLILEESLAAQRYIKARYSHVFIDEYQDTSESQHKLFLKIFELGLISVAVGDVDQSIYGFRGSKPEYLLELSEDSERFKSFAIDINHRSHPSIINYAARLADPDSKLLVCDEDDIRVYRRLLNGNLRDAGKVVSGWTSEWLKDGTISKESDVALLGKKEGSIKELADGMLIKYRLYTESPLDKIGNPCSDLYSDLMAYKFRLIDTIQEIIDKHYFYLLNSRNFKISELRKNIKEIRNFHSIEAVLDKFRKLASMLSIIDTRRSDEAILLILNSKELINLYRPLNDNEVQIMTLHKSKGLEFKVVMHFDLEEWSFPHRIPGVNWDDINYPSLDQDTNLHYVGITRAIDCCILIRTTLRRNSQGYYKNSQPSYFLGLKELEGLYR